jgi:uncharacterized protein
MADDLRARLARMGYQNRSEAVEPAAPGEAQGERPLFPSRLAPRNAPGGVPIGSVVEGSYLPTDFGDCFVAEQHHPVGHPHGVYRLEEALEVDQGVLPWLGRAEELAGMDLSSCAFLDTETTGLAGGTGSYAFLVGLGYFHGSRFVVRQFFMEDFDGEEAMLSALAEAVAPLEGLVTFNGKAFDLPLLETRYSMARMPFPLRGLPHLDLLFPARRLWRERLESCALSSLEAALLGVERGSDVPGWMIPGIYFNYLQNRDARPLGPVFEHNRQDLLSLATLATRLVRQFSDPFHPEVEDSRDLCAMGTVFEGLGIQDRAALCYERAMALELPAELRARTMVRLGNLYKRLRQRQDAVEVWRKLASVGYSYTVVAYVELAKHSEHVARDYPAAERLTTQALVSLELRAARGDPWRVEQERRELEHRLARLRRKQTKGGRQAG